MNEEELIGVALDNLQQTAKVEGTWKGNKSSAADGQVTFTLDQQTVTLPLDIKRELRRHHLTQLNEAPLPRPLILAERISPLLKETLREQGLSYLEANGNFYLKYQDILVLIDGNPPYQFRRRGGNRAFTPAGLQVVFHFLLDNSWIHYPYREIAEKAGVSLGQVKNVMDGLKEIGFLLANEADIWALADRRNLLDKWIGLYGEKLQPKLAKGIFRFVDKDAFSRWQDTPLMAGKTVWGGEPAADLLTNHLRPGRLTLYTSEDRIELMKNYRLVPDENGSIVVYQKFWYQKDQHTITAPSLLVYADLINQGDKRSLETANIIYEQHLRSQF